MISAALLLGAQARTLAFVFRDRICLMASTRVTVFPVPGLNVSALNRMLESTVVVVTHGPKMMKGMPPAGKRAIAVTACS